MRLKPGDKAIPFSAETVEGRTISLAQFAGKPLLLMFFRYASCPMCNLRLRDFAQQYPRLHERGLEVVAFFHSPARKVRADAGNGGGGSTRFWSSDGMNNIEAIAASISHALDDGPQSH